jgi:uncharacterized protein (TIGR03437 family)
VEVRLTNPSGGIATFSGQKRETAPGMLAPPLFNVGGRQYMVAQFPDLVYVGRANLVAGASFRPARPADVITAYGIGFGEVTPPIAPGVVVSALHQLSGVAISFGSTRANVRFAGLAPNFVGLYQFNLEVPDVADGDHQINVTLNGQPLQQPPMYLTVAR